MIARMLAAGTTAAPCHLDMAGEWPALSSAAVADPHPLVVVLCAHVFAPDNPRNRSWTRLSVRFSDRMARREDAAWLFPVRTSNKAKQPVKRAIKCVAYSPFW